jgi:hypothetical protein
VYLLNKSVHRPGQGLDWTPSSHQLPLLSMATGRIIQRRAVVEDDIRLFAALIAAHPK